MEPAFEFPINLGSYFLGKWRVTMSATFEDPAGTKFACLRFFGDVVEL
jgi:hypothetical protein